MWKILNDGNWVIIPNGYEKLSDELWVMSDEWRKLSDKKMNPNNPLIIDYVFFFLINQL